MEIRMLNQQEILPALHLVWDVFMIDNVAEFTPEGVAEFQRYIKYDNIHGMYQRKELYLFGAFDGTDMRGMISVRSNGHISLFFVRKEYQGKGIGKQLFQMVYNYCVQVLHVSTITVNAAPSAVPKYVHMGMHQIGPEELVNGIRSVPMEMYANPGLVKPVKTKNYTPIIVTAVICGVLLLGAVIFGGIYLVKTVVENVTEQNGYEEFQDLPYEYFEDDEWYRGWEESIPDDGSAEEEELSGINAIPEYISDSVSYEIESETYTYTDKEKTSTYIDFYVQYPQLTGLDEKAAEKVNQAIKACAMDTVEKVYNNPSEEIKEKVLGANVPALASYVNYKVCYANEKFISIVFEDYSYQGSYDEPHQNLRTVNIGLDDGKVYEVKDIVTLDDAFVHEWLDEMRSEAANDAFLSEIGIEEYKKTLGGDSLNGVYVVNFFVCADGIEIGYDLNYPKDDSHDLGYVWVTAPFDIDEIEQYASDSEFWKLLK